MPSILESSLLGEVARLKQELVSLKTPQAYGTKQIKTYSSNKVEVRGINFQNTIWGFRAIVKFIGDKPSKNVLGVLKSSITWDDASISREQLEVSQVAQWKGTANEVYFYVNMHHTNQTSSYNSENFTATFWVVGNDSGILTVEETHEWA